MNKYNLLGLRSITYTIDIEKIHDVKYQNRVEKDILYIKHKFSSKKIFLRTLRLNIIKISPKDRFDQYVYLKKIKLLHDFSNKIGIRWFNISFDLINQDHKNVKNICKLGYEIIKMYSNSFINFVISDKENVNPFAALIISQTILDVSKLSFNGYDNFRVGVSLNPTDNTPFFPFSYSSNDFSFSLAVEITERIIDCIKSNKNDLNNLDKLKKTILTNLSPFVVSLDKISKEISKEINVNYGGQDLSLAPFPEDEISVVEILHLLGLDDIGSNGTLFFTSYLTGIIKSLTLENKAKSAGFNGVMYSLLEDHLMCKSNDKKLLTIDKIIGYSTLCGCGLDMVPVPGNLLVEELASIVLDIAATAGKLNKPLGFRILPIPNKSFNEYTEFDMDFLTNTRVVELKQLSLTHTIFNNLNIKL